MRRIKSEPRNRRRKKVCELLSQFIDRKNTLKVALQLLVPFINANEADHCILSVGGAANDEVTEAKYPVLMKVGKF
jgi:hypothetical protein